MKPSLKTFIIVLIVISLVGLVAVYIFSRMNSDDFSKTVTDNNIESGEVAGTTTQGEDDYLKKLTLHLTKEGMVLYGSLQSEETKKQKEMFKSAGKYINYVECDASGANANPDECIGQKIDIYPTWVYQGQKYVGIQNLSDLAKATDFTE